MKPILVIGANGQIGRALAEALRGREAIFWGREEVDLSHCDALNHLLTITPCSAIINAAAYTAVDKAEEEPELAEKVNAYAPQVMAAYCAANNIPFLHYSTDYVFDGSGEKPRTEDGVVAPLSVYGKTKLLGEEMIEEQCGFHLIFRTSWVYDAYGNNFVNTMLRLGAEREELRVVADQIGAPSYAPHLATATLEALDKAIAMRDFPTGTYHMCNAGETSWHGFAEAIFDEARAVGMELKVREVHPIPTSDYPTPATRPLNSRLDCGKLQKTFGITLPDWREGLKECMKVKI